MIKVKTIDAVVSQFLQAQKERLSKRTYRDYDSVMDLFVIYLNSYGPNVLQGEEHKKWEKAYENDESAFTKLFSVSYISSYTYADFLEYFVIRKVASGESFMKNCVRVLKKFSKWLFEHDYINQLKFENMNDYFKGGKASSLSDAEKLSDLLYEHSLNVNYSQFEKIEEGYFTIIEKKNTKLKIADVFTDEPLDGCLIVPKTIVDYCRVGWDLSLVIGKRNGNWYVIESGNVYPAD